MSKKNKKQATKKVSLKVSSESKEESKEESTEEKKSLKVTEEGAKKDKSLKSSWPPLANGLSSNRPH